MHLIRQITVLVPLCLSMGCYYYQPLMTPAPEPGTYLQVMLTDSGTSHFWSYIGPDVGDLRGRLVTADNAAIALSVESVELRHGQVLSWKGESVTLGREYVATLQERRLSKSRTVLAAAGSVAAFIAALTAYSNIGVGSNGGGGGGYPR